MLITPDHTRHALENNGITALKQLSRFSEVNILKFHGMGKTSLPKLKEALAKKGSSFKTK
jgi:DNA-directed RNA polymerase alpha subunit